MDPLPLALLAAALVRADPAYDDRIASRLGITEGIPKEHVVELRRAGFEWPDVIRALVISRLSTRPPLVVAWLKQGGLPWGEVARRFGLDEHQVEDLARALEGQVLAPSGLAGAGRD